MARVEDDPTPHNSTQSRAEQRPAVHRLLWIITECNEINNTQEVHIADRVSDRVPLCYIHPQDVQLFTLISVSA
jgi:hypothetical protein